MPLGHVAQTHCLKSPVPAALHSQAATHRTVPLATIWHDACQRRCSRHRTVIFGIRLFDVSLAPVDGDVSLVRSHSVMAVRSYVKPSAVQTGSVMISAVMGHLYSLKNSTAPACPPLPLRLKVAA